MIFFANCTLLKLGRRIKKAADDKKVRLDRTVTRVLQLGAVHVVNELSGSLSAVSGELLGVMQALVVLQRPPAMGQSWILKL